MSAQTSGLTVKARIYGGFTILIAFMCIVVGVAIIQLGSVTTKVAFFATTAKDTVDVLKIDRAVADIRRMVLVFADKGDPKVADAIRTQITALKTAIADSARTNPEPDHKALLAEMSGLLDQYVGLFDKAAEQRLRRDTLVAEMTPLGAQAVQHLSDLADTANATKDWETGAMAGKGLQEVLVTRMNVLRFITFGDPKVAEDTLQRFAMVGRLLAKLAEEEKDPIHRKPILAAAEIIPPYARGFSELVTSVNQLERIIGKDLPALGAKFADSAIKIRDGELAGLAQTEAELGETVSVTTTVTQALGTIAVLLGILFAYLIARSIIRPINAMTGAMGDLAGGKLDAEVPALDRHDEIGEMAKAVQVFKQNAVDKVRMEAEAAAAREARAKEEAESRAREAAIVAEVAEVAKAASAGDLDRRINLAGKDGFLLSLCEGVNNLVHLTGVALKDVASVLSAVAQGDLTQRITNQYDGVFGRLKGDVNTTADKLFEIVTNINSAAGQIGSAASEVSAGSQDLSERSEQQASALEETAASMEELAATVRQNATNAQQANQLAAGAREVAAGGGQVVTDAISAMARIQSSSSKIEDIVGMIDEIAFQTNLLALNAAVEAARAGDAGKGFAVVAQEVRNLAQRSAQASKEIKTLIAESSTQVRTGGDLVKGAGKTLEDILGSVKRVADIVAEIAAASSEQAAGIDQVNAAVSQMDEMTQQNAALVEESAAAAHALEEQSQELNRLMGFFNTGELRAEAAPQVKREAKPQPKPAVKATMKPPAVKAVLRPAAKPMAKPTVKLAVKAAAKPVSPRTTPAPTAAATATKDEDWAEF